MEGHCGCCVTSHASCQADGVSPALVLLLLLLLLLLLRLQPANLRLSPTFCSVHTISSKSAQQTLADHPDRENEMGVGVKACIRCR